jgi:hypothetical protein
MPGSPRRLIDLVTYLPHSSTHNGSGVSALNAPATIRKNHGQSPCKAVAHMGDRTNRAGESGFASSAEWPPRRTGHFRQSLFPVDIWLATITS